MSLNQSNKYMRVSKNTVKTGITVILTKQCTYKLKILLLGDFSISVVSNMRPIRESVTQVILRILYMRKGGRFPSISNEFKRYIT